MAGVLERAGRVLLSQRPTGSHLAGCWEFPGGKVDQGEARVVALKRELREELGIVVTSAEPLIRIQHTYPECSIDLDVWRVITFEGEPLGAEGQLLQWVDTDVLHTVPMPAADRPVLKALQLPDRYVISAADHRADGFWDALQRCLSRGDWVQLRLPGLREQLYADVARRALEMAQRHSSARLLLNSEPDLALRLGAHGVHLNGSLLWRLSKRPLPVGFWVGVSCHDVLDLRRAGALDADFAVLGPVKATQTHTGAVPLGWCSFQSFVAQARIPTFALGGTGPDDIEQARKAGAQGIAAISALWDSRG